MAAETYAPPVPVLPLPRRVAVKIALLRAALRMAPARRHAVVAGFPDEEGNSVEMVRALARRMPVYWLVDKDPASVRWLLAGAGAAYEVRCLRKNSAAAFLAYLTARYVFFTHGLYGSPEPPPGRTVVNLWHGDGPKRSKGFAYVHSTHVIAGTQLWGAPRPSKFGVRHPVLVTGNPRMDQLGRPAPDAVLRELGLDPEKPLVLWLPTYRRTDYRGRRLGRVRNWADAGALSESAGMRSVSQGICEMAERLGITVAIKPHPMDADEFRGASLPLVTTEQLSGAEATLYQLLARTHGLITDYSSVWTDYLCMDRPIGFFCPDLLEYDANRGLNVPNYSELLPGPRLETPADFAAFLQDCLDESDASRALRARSIARIGAEVRMGAAERLLTELSL